MAYGNPYKYTGMSGAGLGAGGGSNYSYGQQGSNQGGGYGRLKGAGYSNPYAQYQQQAPNMYSPGGYGTGGGGGYGGSPGGYNPYRSQGTYASRPSGRGGIGGFGGMPGGVGAQRDYGGGYGAPDNRRGHMGRGPNPWDSYNLGNKQLGILNAMGNSQFAPQMAELMMLQNLGYDPAQFGMQDIQSKYYGTGNPGSGPGKPR